MRKVRLASRSARWSTVVPFCILPFGLLATKEYQLWPEQLYNTGSVRNTVIIMFLSFALCESKHLDRFCKYAIVENTSTIFFAGVDSAMKMVAGIMSFVFFPSSTPSAVWPTVLGFLFIAMAVTLLYIDKRLKSSQVEADQLTKQVLDIDDDIELVDADSDVETSFNPLVPGQRQSSRAGGKSQYVRVQSSDIMEGNTSSDSLSNSESSQSCQTPMAH